MGNDTTDYFDAMERFNFACTQRNYRAALVDLRKGLRLTPAALTSMHSRFGGQPSVPFFESKGGAIASLFDDSESFDLMDSIMAMDIVSRKVDVSRYRRDSDVIMQVRLRLQQERHLTLSKLKADLPAEDGARLSRLLDWMSKHGEVTVEKVGKETHLTAGKPDQQTEDIPPTFREGLAPAPTPLLRFTTRLLGEDKLGDLTAGKEDIYSEYNRRDADTVVNELRLAPDVRQPSIMKTRVSAEGTWLIAGSKELPDGTFTTLVNRYFLDGTRTGSLVLPHRISGASSDVGRSEIVTIDPRLSIRTYNFEGELLASLSLWDNPDVRDIYNEAPLGTKETAVVRGIDMSASRQEVAFSIVDRFWLFKLSGELVVSFRMPAVPSQSVHLMGDGPSVDLQTALVARGLPADSTKREIAAWLDGEDFMPVSLLPSMSVSMSISIGAEPVDEELIDIGGVAELDAIVREVGGLRADWIYFLRLSNDGDTIWVSAYSGVVAQVSRTGRVLHAWVLPTSVGDLVEVEDRTFVAQQAWFSELVAGRPPVPICRGFGYDSMLAGRLISKRYERDVVVGDLLTGQTRAVTLARDFRASYPALNGVRVETATTFADIGM